MNFIFKNICIATFLMTLCFMPQHVHAMKNNKQLLQFLEQHKEKEMVKKKHEYCLKLLINWYDRNEMLSQSALDKLSKLSLEEVKNRFASLSKKSSEEEYNSLMEYAKHYYNKTEKKLIGLNEKEKEVHAKFMNHFFPAFKNLESVKEIKNDLENSVLSYAYDKDDVKFEEDEEEVVEKPIKKQTKKRPTSPSIDIIYSAKNDYSLGKENYSPSKEKEIKISPKKIELCDISFINKKVKKSFINWEQKEKIEGLSREEKNNLDSDENQGSIKIAREKTTSFDEKEKYFNPFVIKNIVIKKSNKDDYKKTIDNDWSPFDITE